MLRVVWRNRIDDDKRRKGKGMKRKVKISLRHVSFFFFPSSSPFFPSLSRLFPSVFSLLDARRKLALIVLGRDLPPAPHARKVIPLLRDYRKDRKGAAGSARVRGSAPGEFLRSSRPLNPSPSRYSPRMIAF